MRANTQGIGELIEYWIEQYHQTKFKYGIKNINMAGEDEDTVTELKDF